MTNRSHCFSPYSHRLHVPPFMLLTVRVSPPAPFQGEKTRCLPSSLSRYLPTNPPPRTLSRTHAHKHTHMLLPDHHRLPHPPLPPPSFPPSLSSIYLSGPARQEHDVPGQRVHQPRGGGPLRPARLRLEVRRDGPDTAARVFVCGGGAGAALPYIDR